MSTRFLKGYSADAGIDILLENNISIQPGMNVINLGKFINIPEGTCVIIAPRSSAAKQGLFIANCPVDANYTGDIHAMVFNASNNTIVYEKGSAFCQAVCLKTYQLTGNVVIKKAGKRGDNGFGSTGKGE